MKLKNGTDESATLVSATMMTLELLLSGKPVIFAEAVLLARDRTYLPFAPDLLREYALVGSDNRTHDSVRNVVLSAVTGEGFDLTLGDPRAA